MKPSPIMIDGNEAAARIAYKLSEIIAIYPITPASPMGEWADAWSSGDQKNIWGTTPLVQEMQSEAGAAGALHGALQAGTLATTFTASQGLLLMIPNMFKIAGELTPAVIHVAARTVATHALSIFGDHSDVMAVRGTGWAELAANSVQEAMDMALVAHVATLKSRIPFIHFFDGFRTSHEILKIDPIPDDVIISMFPIELLTVHRARSLTPDAPVIRGTAQNPDVFFQSREAANLQYSACPEIVQSVMDELAKHTGRAYRLFDYVGDPNADRVIIIMGSGAETTEETVKALNKSGEKVGVLKVRLYRPFSIERFVAALPKTVKKIAVLDRTKEPGAGGEPLYQDVISAIHEASPFKAPPLIIGGRYGLSSKEFTPAMARAVFNELKKERPKNHFTVGINDDVSHTSLDYDPNFNIEPENQFRGMFYGLGSDGTVGGNKSSIKIIGELTANSAQGYFVYDSKKSGSTTISHLRFGPDPVRAPYLVQQPKFVGCHQFGLLEMFDVLGSIEKNGTFLLNSPFGPDKVWDQLPGKIQNHIREKNLSFYVIDAYKIAKENKLGGRINTIMQTCFFEVANLLPSEKALETIKKSIQKAYGNKGDMIVRQNIDAVESSIANLHKVNVPKNGTAPKGAPPASTRPEFFEKFFEPIIKGQGDSLPVSAFPSDGTFPVGTGRYEKRNIAAEIPVWDESVCIQCGKCVLVCPHAVIRANVFDPAKSNGAPEGFKTAPTKNRDWAGQSFTLQVAPEDCTGCSLCVEVCPAKNKSETRLKAINMRPQAPILEAQKKNWDYFLTLPEINRQNLKKDEVRSSALLEPLFEFSGACGGCGETPYVKLISQLFGDRMLLANATGCSSIYGGNLPTTPWSKNKDGRGPAWSNSLFEDNAEFGLGFRLAVDKKREMAAELLHAMKSDVGEALVDLIFHADQQTETGIHEQRERVAELKNKLKSFGTSEAKRLLDLADYLVKKSVWIMGGDGWAYDIGFGGLDHVLASGRDINILVLDTEVYSNTGGQMSKSTPRGAVAKFAAGGKTSAKKDLGLMAMTYGSVYVGSVAMGARDEHTIRTFLEAESYPGPSLIIAYSHCIAHGIDMAKGMMVQKEAVQSGYWQLYRFDPRMVEQGKNPLRLDSTPGTVSYEDFAYKQNRFKMLSKMKPAEAKRLLDLATQDIKARRAFYEYLASRPGPVNSSNEKETPTHG